MPVADPDPFVGGGGGGGGGGEGANEVDWSKNVRKYKKCSAGGGWGGGRRDRREWTPPLDSALLAD